MVAAISDWNGGISSPSRKGGAALAAGNAVVVKAMGLRALLGRALRRVGAGRAGLPPGLVNVIVGGPDGASLVRHPDVRKVSFTGGVETARKILATAAESITPVVLELGGKSGSIVFADADLEAASRFSGATPMGLAGQACVSPSRLIVHESVHDEVVERATAVTRSLPLGDPLDAATVVGPVVSEAQYDRILGMIARARQSGLATWSPAVAATADFGDGFFIEPTIFDGQASEDYIAQEEVLDRCCRSSPSATRTRPSPWRTTPATGWRLHPHQQPPARPPRGGPARCRVYLGERLRRLPARRRSGATS